MHKTSRILDDSKYGELLILADELSSFKKIHQAIRKKEDLSQAGMSKRIDKISDVNNKYYKFLNHYKKYRGRGFPQTFYKIDWNYMLKHLFIRVEYNPKRNNSDKIKPDYGYIITCLKNYFNVLKTNYSSFTLNDFFNNFINGLIQNRLHRNNKYIIKKNNDNLIKTKSRYLGFKIFENHIIHEELKKYSNKMSNIAYAACFLK